MFSVNSTLYKLMREVGADKFSIELVEDFPCEAEDELGMKENNGYIGWAPSTTNSNVERLPNTE